MIERPRPPEQRNRNADALPQPGGEIEIVAKGKRDLLVPTADGVREPQNRRVQIVYSGSAGS